MPPPLMILSPEKKLTLAVLGMGLLFLLVVASALFLNLPQFETILLFSGLVILIITGFLRLLHRWVTQPLNLLIEKTKNDERILKEQAQLQRVVTDQLEKKHEELETLFLKVEKGKQEWEITIDHLKDFILLTDPDHRIVRYNKLLAEVTGRPHNSLLGYEWSDLLTGAGFQLVNFDGVTGKLIHQPTKRTYDILIYEIRNETIFNGYIVSLKDTTELRAAKEELEKSYAELMDAKGQIYQQEKLASLGQLAAGVAHEINNPIAFVTSNLASLEKYVEHLATYITAAHQALVAGGNTPAREALAELRENLKIDYILDDSSHLIAESRDGAERVRCIVQNLNTFSRLDLMECTPIDLNEALETTINIALHQITYVATLSKEYGKIPPLRCFPQQLNQVFLNLLMNAAHAVEEGCGEIAVRTWCEQEEAYISIADNGTGIPFEIQPRVFDPFFTTKPVGKGTGLGLSVSYDIVQKHNGNIHLESTPGQGTTFIVRLPLSGPRQEKN